MHHISTDIALQLNLRKAVTVFDALWLAYLSWLLELRPYHLSCQSSRPIFYPTLDLGQTNDVAISPRKEYPSYRPLLLNDESLHSRVSI